MIRGPRAVQAVRARWATFDRARGKSADTESGMAVIEFVFLGLLLLIPLIYIVMCAAQLQAAAFATSLAGREAGRAFVTSTSGDSADSRAHAAANLAFADFGFDGGGGLKIVCDGSPCLRPEGNVTMTASVQVRLPLVPDFIADRVPSSITISSTHVATVDRFRAQ